MLPILIELTYNLALLVALSTVSGFIGDRLSGRWGALLQGLLFGTAAVIGMLRPLILAPGLIFDGRSVMISLGGLFSARSRRPSAPPWPWPVASRKAE